MGEKKNEAWRDMLGWPKDITLSNIGDMVSGTYLPFDSLLVLFSIGNPYPSSFHKRVRLAKKNGGFFGVVGGAKTYVTEHPPIDGFEFFIIWNPSKSIIDKEYVVGGISSEISK